VSRRGTLKGRGYKAMYPEHGMSTHRPATYALPIRPSSRIRQVMAHVPLSGRYAWNPLLGKR